MNRFKKVITVVVALCLTSTVFTACAGSGSASKKDTFIYAVGADPRGLDPAMVDDGESAAVIVNIYEGLTKYNDSTTAVEPCLAKSWDISPDGLEYTFNLRDDVTFQDGTKFDANAVKVSIDRQLPPNDTSNMPYSAFTFGYVKSVDVVSDYVVKITLTQPSTPFLANLAMSQAAPIVSPEALKKSTTGNINEAPVGTGPFSFAKWDKGVAVSLVRNDKYWGEKAKLKNLIFQVTPENSTRASQMMAGAVDAMNGLDASNVESVKAKGAQIFQADGMNINYLAFNTTRPPFDDPKLREAVIHSINVDELVKSLYQGYAQPAYSVLPSFMPGYNEKTKPYAYDPEKAKQILKDAGKENLSIKIITYSNPRPYNAATGTKLAEAVQGYLSKVGITADITQYDWKTYKDKSSQGEGDICFYGWIGDNGDPDNFMNLLADKDRSMNVAGYANPDYISLIQKAVTLPNGNDRNALYQQMEDIVAKDGVWLPISHAQSMAAYGKNVQGFTIHPTGNTFFANVTKN